MVAISPLVMKQSARLLAVQAVYQASLNEQSLESVSAEYLEHRVSMEVEGEEMAEPDKALFRKVVLGVEERRGDLGGVIATHTQAKGEKFEPLIKAVLMCASFELLAHTDIDSPIIINDYLNVAHAYFDKGEVGLINAVLDNVAKAVRD